MLAVNYSTIRNNFKGYCDKAVLENETIIVTRKNEENIVILSLEEWNAMHKRLERAEYLAKLDYSMSQVKQGKVVVKTLEELEAMENE